MTDLEAMWDLLSRRGTPGSLHDWGVWPFQKVVWLVKYVKNELGRVCLYLKLDVCLSFLLIVGLLELCVFEVISKSKRLVLERKIVP